MSQRLETSAEILKLARLVEQDPDQLGFLDSVSPAELRALREGVTNTIFDAGAQSLKRVAAGAKLLPSPLVAAMPCLPGDWSGTERWYEVSVPAPYIASSTIGWSRIPWRSSAGTSR